MNNKFILSLGILMIAIGVTSMISGIPTASAGVSASFCIPEDSNIVCIVFEEAIASFEADAISQINGVVFVDVDYEERTTEIRYDKTIIPLSIDEVVDRVQVIEYLTRHNRLKLTQRPDGFPDPVCLLDAGNQIKYGYYSLNGVLTPVAGDPRCEFECEEPGGCPASAGDGFGGIGNPSFLNSGPEPEQPHTGTHNYPKVDMTLRSVESPEMVGVQLVINNPTSPTNWITSQWLIEYDDTKLDFVEIEDHYDYFMSGIFEFGDPNIPNEGCFDMNDDAYDGDFAYTNFVGLQESIEMGAGDEFISATIWFERTGKGDAQVSLYLKGEEMNPEWWCERSNVIKIGGLHLENEGLVTQTIYV